MSAVRMLPEPFDLPFTATGEVVRDVEALARGVLGAERWPCYLEPADERELLATLLSDAVLLEPYYRRRAGIEARPWLFQRLRWKARDWRETFHLGRGGQNRVLGELGHGDPGDADDLEMAGGADPWRGDRVAGLGSGSHGAPGEIAGDRGDPGLDALRRLLESGDRALLREVEALGLSAPPGARGRSPEADRALARLERKRLRRVRELEREAVAA